MIFAKRFKLPYISLPVSLSVAKLMVHSVITKRLGLDCPVEFEGNELIANLIILAMDCILRIDILTTYRTTVDCYQKIVQFRPVESDVGICMVR